jgi:TPR repeat protein
MYRYGQGVEKNFDEACRLNKLASDQGNVIAQYYS